MDDIEVFSIFWHSLNPGPLPSFFPQLWRVTYALFETEIVVTILWTCGQRTLQKGTLLNENQRQYVPLSKAHHVCTLPHCNLAPVLVGVSLSLSWPDSLCFTLLLFPDGISSVAKYAPAHEARTPFGSACERTSVKSMFLYKMPMGFPCYIMNTYLYIYGLKLHSLLFMCDVRVNKIPEMSKETTYCHQ